MTWALVSELGATGWMLVALLPVGMLVALATGWGAHRSRLVSGLPIVVFSLPAMLALHATHTQANWGVVASTMPDVALTTSRLLIPVGAHTLAAFVGLPGVALLLGVLAGVALTASERDGRRAAGVVVVGMLAALLVLGAGWASDELYLGKRRAGVVLLAGLLAGIASSDRDRPELSVVSLAGVALTVGYVEMWWCAHVYAEAFTALPNVPATSRLILTRGALEFIPAARPWQWAALAVPTLATVGTLASHREDDPWRRSLTAIALIGPIAIAFAWVSDGRMALEMFERALQWR